MWLSQLMVAASAVAFCLLGLAFAALCRSCTHQEGCEAEISQANVCCGPGASQQMAHAPAAEARVVWPRHSQTCCLNEHIADGHKDCQLALHARMLHSVKCLQDGRQHGLTMTFTLVDLAAGPCWGSLAASLSDCILEADLSGTFSCRHASRIRCQSANPAQSAAVP